jgi:hypothetical protein
MIVMEDRLPHPYLVPGGVAGPTVTKSVVLTPVDITYVVGLRPVDVPVREDGVAVVEDAAVGIRLAWQAPEGVPLGLDLEAVHGRPDDGDVGTPIGLGNPELKDCLG